MELNEMNFKNIYEKLLNEEAGDEIKIDELIEFLPSNIKLTDLKNYFQIQYASSPQGKNGAAIYLRPGYLDKTTIEYLYKHRNEINRIGITKGCYISFKPK